MNCALVLAAGESTRMGQQKVILPYGNTTIVGHIVSVLHASQVDWIGVVTGYRPDAVGAALEGGPAKLIHNACYAEGMLSSIRAGLRALPQEVRNVLVALGDQPAIDSSLVNELLSLVRDKPGALAVPRFGARRGHPLLFSAGYIPEVLTDFEVEGLRGLLARHADKVIEFPATNDGVLQNVDTPEDYAKLVWKQDTT